jgi:hypothetical protein
MCEVVPWRNPARNFLRATVTGSVTMPCKAELNISQKNRILAMTGEIVAFDVETIGPPPNLGIGYPLKNWLSLGYHMI